MAAHNPENGEQRQSPEKKFTKLRDLVLLMGKVHSEHIGGSREKGSPAYLGDELVKILSGLKATGQMNEWQPDLRIKIISQTSPEVRLVRKMGDQKPEISDLILLPRNSRSFLLALDAYTEGKSWDEVIQMLGRRHEHGVDRAQIEELENEAVDIRTFEDAGNLAARVHMRLTNQHSQTSVMRVVHRIVEMLIEEKTKDLTEFRQLQKPQLELEAFAKSQNGKYFVTSMFFDFIDAAALRIGRKMISDARSADELRKVLQAIHGHAFRFADAYTAPFAESQEDAIAKLDFLEKLRNKRSAQGLDDLRKEVEAYQFKSAEMAPKYREQIVGFIERKREVYWP